MIVVELLLLVVVLGGGAWYLSSRSSKKSREEREAQQLADAQADARRGGTDPLTLQSLGSSYRAGEALNQFPNVPFFTGFFDNFLAWVMHGTAPPPPLPAEVAERTRARYVEAFERLTGERF